MNPRATIRSLAIQVPSTARSNDYWLRHHPDLVADARERTLARVWSIPPGQTGTNAYEAAMRPFMDDPFRGAKNRRVLAPGETALSLEAAAAREALRAAKLGPEAIDVAFVGSFLPDTFGVGNGAALASELGLRCAAFNLESACSSALAGLQAASVFVRAGDCRYALVVVSCTYSRNVDVRDTLAWSLGDAAAAMVVGPAGDVEGFLAFDAVHTGASCGSMLYEAVPTADGVRMAMRAGPKAGEIMRRTGEETLVGCTDRALSAARLSRDDIDFFIMPTPVAWYSSFCALALGYPADRTINMHPTYANMGPALLPTNLYHALLTKQVVPRDTILLHTVGSVSSSMAAVLRCGEIALGPPPSAPTRGE